MRYLSEIRSKKEISPPAKLSLSTKEINAALHLIQELSQPFRPEKYKDTYEAELKKIITKKGGSLPKEKKEKILDLVPALEASLKKKKKRLSA